ncbi:MAG: dihydroorotase [Phycisphaerales bacterium]|nr:dihydroorotase [Phycisphaerales bacterium]
MASVLIAGGRVLDPASGLDRAADVAVKDGKIAAIGPGLARPGVDRVINAEGCLVTPGLIDPHVHLREPGQEHKETIASGARAAVAGGFTTVCCMPNTSPALDTPELVRFVLGRGEQSAARVFPVAAISKQRRGNELAEISLMARAGAVGFSDDGDCVASAGLMARALAVVKPTGLAIMQHAQDPTLTKGASMHAGEIALKLGLGGWPRVAEEVIVERDIRLNRGIGCRYHVQHISSGETVAILRRARAEGQPVSGEASPHHLLLTHEACIGADGLGYNTMAKVNPPVRETSDMKALREGIADGTITVLATDHAPHTDSEKALPFEEAPFGLVGLETALALYIEALVSSGVIGWMKLVQLMTVGPAKLCGLDRMGLGRLEVGGPGDVTVIDPEVKWTIGQKDLVGASNNTPFLGRKVKGRAIATVVGGEVKWEGGR